MTATGRGPAYQELAATLRGRILAGEFGPGDRLPVEPELCELYGVSRSTVREALRVLSSQGLITTSRGVSGGSFVVHPGPGHISDYLQTSLSLLAGGTGAAGGSVADLIEVRELLEVPAAGLAALRRTSEHLEALRAAVAGGGASAATDVLALYAANRDFHLNLLRAAGNPLLEAVAGPVFTVLAERFLREDAPPEVWAQVDREHRDILAAVDAGDEAAARQAAHEHLERLRPTYERIDRQALQPR